MSVKLTFDEARLTPCGYCRRCAIHDDPGGCLEVTAYEREVAAQMVEPLPPLNTNYEPPRPWVCASVHPHYCEGPVVGKIGAVPCCAEGAREEVAERIAAKLRMDEFLASPEGQEMLRAEARLMRMEARHA